MAERQEIKGSLGIAKFNLQQANNELFVAQAVKEQADKATAILYLESTALPTNSSIKSNFGGC